MSNNHEGHSHGPKNLQNINNAFYIGIGLNLVYTIIEFIIGYRYDSLALISDAFHNLSDVASLIISLIALKLTQKAANLTYTYGYKKASILASFINSILLIIVVIGIFKEAIERLEHIQEVGGSIIIITALIGVGINTISALLFFKGQKDDINIKGAFLHLLVDALVSVGVVISGVIIYYTGWNIVDTIISMLIAIIILITTLGLFRESLKLTLDGVPKNVNLIKVKEVINTSTGVKDLHHIHVWGLSSTINALSAHIILDKDYSLSQIIQIKEEIKHKLKRENINHTTIEVDSLYTNCTDLDCN